MGGGKVSVKREVEREEGGEGEGRRARRTHWHFSASSYIFFEMSCDGGELGSVFGECKKRENNLKKKKKKSKKGYLIFF